MPRVFFEQVSSRFPSLFLLLLGALALSSAAAPAVQARLEGYRAPVGGLQTAPLSYAEQKITSPDGGREFGQAVAISGDTALVGSPTSGTGSAYVFIRSGTAWSFQQKLTPPDGTATQGFGHWVAISGDTVVVGSPSDDIGANYDQGSAYVYTRSGTTWSLQQRLIAPDGGQFDSFGDTLAVWGNTAFVSAFGHNSDTGAVYLFVRSGTIWSLQQELTASDGAPGDWFGTSVALSYDTAVIGAELANISPGTDQGAAYIFVQNGATWTQQAKLTASDGETNDRFGCSVALAGDTALVGAPSDDNFQGSAYVFSRNGTTWTQQKLTALSGAADKQFGISVALAGDTAIAGAFLDHVGLHADQGSAYVFTRTGATWTQHTVLTASDGEAYDDYGVSVALSGYSAVIGAYGHDWAQGAAYGYTLPITIYVPFSIQTVP